MIGQATAPISSTAIGTPLPYVPPLANTFASTNVIPSVPVGKSDAEIVFAGVANMNLGNQSLPPAIPTVSSAADALTNQATAQPLQPQQIQQIPQMAQQQPPTQVPNQQSILQPTIDAAAVSPPPMQTAPSNQQQQPAQIFGSVPPTNIPSLNQSFNIQPTIMNPIPTSTIPSHPPQGPKKWWEFKIVVQITNFSSFFFDWFCVGNAIPQFNTFSSVPPPSSIANLPGFEAVFEPRPSQPQQTCDASQQLPHVQTYMTSQAYAPTTTNVTDDAAAYYSQPPMQTYLMDTYPQVTTPISLPGMPPITVSTTIPPHHFQNYLHQPPPTTQSQ